jgi:hypothetical protein
MFMLGDEHSQLAATSIVPSRHGFRLASLSFTVEVTYGATNIAIIPSRLSSAPKDLMLRQIRARAIQKRFRTRFRSRISGARQESTAFNRCLPQHYFHSEFLRATITFFYTRLTHSTATIAL